MGRTIRNKNKQDKKRLKQYRNLRKKRGFSNDVDNNHNKNNYRDKESYQ